jgi:hypothetical protein
MAEPKLTLEQRAEEYAKQLSNISTQPGPLAYLGKHGIEDREIMDRYMIGCVRYPLPGDERFKGCLSLPYQTRRGIVSLKYRCCLPHDCQTVSGHQKYSQYHGQNARPYNANAFFMADGTIGICEGEVDAISITEFIGLPTIGLPGATQWQKNSKYWLLALKDYEKIIIFADGDDVGRSSARAIAGDIGSRARLVRCDDGEDPSDMIANGKIEQLKKMAGLK